MNSIIITGTILPSVDSKYLSDKNPISRYTQYVKNICRFITETSIDNIIFCENSNYLISNYDDIINIAKLYNKKLEILQFKWNADKVFALGRGYGEQEILEYTVQNSKLLSEQDEFYKITWRYRVHNIDKIVNENILTPNVFSVISPLDKRCSTAFFKCSKTFFVDVLWWCWDEVNDSLWEDFQLEWIYYKRISKVKQSTVNFSTMPIFSANTWSGYILRPNIFKDWLKQFCNILWLYKI